MNSVTMENTKKLPTFWLGVSSLFDFSGSIPIVLTSTLNKGTINDALKSDAQQIALDMRRVFDRETPKN